MNIQKNVNLKEYNTFQTSAIADYFLELENIDDLQQLITKKLLPSQKILILGLGANILFTKDFDGLVIKNNLKGIKVLDENEDNVMLQVCSGENWHNLVEYTVNMGWSGIENLALIPGTVGAAATQNIAAYGQNFEDILVNLSALDLETGKIVNFTNKDCQFSYRDSIFKKPDHKKFFVITVDLKLSKKPIFSTSYQSRYESLSSELDKFPTPHTSKQVFQAVINLRQSKLPDWNKIPTVGSFFRNPIVSKEKFLELSQKISQLQSYPVEKLSYEKQDLDDFVKIPAGRLLDELGWKGKRIGNAGTFHNNALVIISFGASGQEILEFSKQMQKDCLEKYGVELIPEVNII